MPQTPSITDQLNSAAPSLADEVENLVSVWLEKLEARLNRGPIDVRAKHLNDPIWRTIELYPWEVALLDSPLLQRLRGVRQLGLAQYVFPGAGHDRLEHVCGVVGAVEATVQALRRQIERANLVPDCQPLPQIGDDRRFELRLAGLLHDIGHGPFSHAIEPVLQYSIAETSKSTNQTRHWKRDVGLGQQKLFEVYSPNKRPSVSETLSAMMVASPAMQRILGHSNFPLSQGRRGSALQEAIIAAIVGAINGPGADHLCLIVSSQIDADKLDYLARDAHHAGLEIGFDTHRLLAKLEVLAVRENRLADAAEDMKKRAREAPNGVYYDIGIAASGFGSFEQMLIGRTFLYDRLYHHHKVRAADAMAQRLVITAQEEREADLKLSDMFAQVSDDTMIRVLGSEVTHRTIKGGSDRASGLARAILDRELHHRAFAFRGRFIACPRLSEKDKEDFRQAAWGNLVKTLATLEERRRLEYEIFRLSVTIGDHLATAFPDDRDTKDAIEHLKASGPEQVIVDLPERKADAIRILARYSNDRLAVPEFSFNPVKWADAYDLQKRTGFVFCPRKTVALIELASKLVFLRRFGVVMAKEADGFIKAPEIKTDWLQCLLQAEIIDEQAVQHLQEQRYSLLRFRPEDIPVPSAWHEEDPDTAVRLSNDLNDVLPAGLIGAEKNALTKTLDGFFRILDTWHGGDRVTQKLSNEAALQKILRELLSVRGVAITEGTELSGGETDLVAEGRILIENKITEQVDDPFSAKPTAAAQGRRYAIALGARIVIVALAYIPKAGHFLSKIKSVRVRRIGTEDDRRAEIRIAIPYGAVVPSKEISMV